MTDRAILKGLGAALQRAYDPAPRATDPDADLLARLDGVPAVPVTPPPPAWTAWVG
ncbi:hypothetical protein LPN01_13035 [Sphingomonas sp. A2-49]|uniref:hypothetical protein n=1 Tax=Sphingomonas sp. A2-49 TaxID=1391375 RepID=UPI0021CED7C6|nr:hypothetical protein [Sphingomonas sp. A2-49]MCU6455004.1 hypothetical protein [Sphingomonas sp. A2-49]